MNKKDLSEYKKKYDTARHHGWAGSVLLAVLVASRGFIQLTDYKIDDRIILGLGFILILYILIAVFFTYKYRSGLSAEQKTIQEVHIKTDDADLEKERLKVEKKKAKTEVKKAKKIK